MWELDCEESWAPKNWCFWAVVLEKTLQSPLDCKEIQPVHPRGDQSWVFIGRTDVEAGTPILWPPHAKSWLIGKDPDAGMDWGQEEKGTTEDEMAGWHHQLDGHELESTPGVGDGQGGLACWDSWGHKESDTTELLNWHTDRYLAEILKGIFLNLSRIKIIISNSHDTKLLFYSLGRIYHKIVLTCRSNFRVSSLPIKNRRKKKCVSATAVSINKIAFTEFFQWYLWHILGVYFVIFHVFFLILNNHIST